MNQRISRLLETALLGRVWVFQPVDGLPGRLRYFWEAYNKPDAPKQFLGPMLSAMQKTGSFDRAAIAMEAMMNSTDNPNLRTIYAKKLVRLKNLDTLMKADTAYKQTTGDFPETLKVLVSSGLLKKTPEDPDGMAYAWNKEKNLPGTVK